MPRVLGGPHFRGVHQLTLEGGTAAGARRELAAGNPREAIGVTEELLPLPGKVIPGAIVFAVLALGGAGREVVEAKSAGAEGRREAGKEVERAGRKVLVIGGKGEVGADAAVGEDDGTSFEHVEAVGRRRGWAERGGVWEGEGEKGRVIRWEFRARVRVRVRVGFGLGFGGRGGGGFGIAWGFDGGGVRFPAGFTVGGGGGGGGRGRRFVVERRLWMVAAGHPARRRLQGIFADLCLTG